MGRLVCRPTPGAKLCRTPVTLQPLFCHTHFPASHFYPTASIIQYTNCDVKAIAETKPHMESNNYSPFVSHQPLLNHTFCKQNCSQDCYWFRDAKVERTNKMLLNVCFIPSKIMKVARLITNTCSSKTCPHNNLFKLDILNCNSQ